MIEPRYSEPYKPYPWRRACFDINKPFKIYCDVNWRQDVWIRRFLCLYGNINMILVTFLRYVKRVGSLLGAVRADHGPKCWSWRTAQIPFLVYRYRNYFLVSHTVQLYQHLELLVFGCKEHRKKLKFSLKKYSFKSVWNSLAFTPT